MFKKLLNNSLFYLPIILILTILSWFSHSDSYAYSGLFINSLVIGSALTIIASLLIFGFRKLHRFSNGFLGLAYLTVAILLILSSINTEFKSWSLGFLIPITIALITVEIIQKFFKKDVSL